MPDKVPTSLYWPDTADSTIDKLRRNIMPTAFIRRMRLINLMSAIALDIIEPDKITPFTLEDVGHILDRQISQDAIIDQLDNKILATALATGDISLLSNITQSNPMLVEGFTVDWIQRFFGDPFNPLCVMMAMRVKMFLDCLQNYSSGICRSYNLLHVGSMAAPWGFLDQGLGTGRPGYSGTSFSGVDPCLHIGGTGLYAYIGYTTLLMTCNDAQNLTVEGDDPPLPDANYTWAIYPNIGSLSATIGHAVTYTAPASGINGNNYVDISLYCKNQLIDSIHVNLTACPVSATIGYTTQQMAVNLTQVLTAVPDGATCETPVYDWEITAGGGSLSAAQGESVIYTAPATNAECANNPTIQLSCGGVVLDTLQIAVNASSGQDQYVIATSSCTGCVCDIYKQRYNCNGAANGSSVACDGCSCSAAECSCGGDPVFHCVEGELLARCTAAASCGTQNGFTVACSGTTDCRTAAQKTAGCCPAAVL